MIVMNTSENVFFDWSDLRDAEGKLGRVGPIVDLIAKDASKGQLVEMKQLTEILLIPGVLCSAAPQVVSEFLSAMPKAVATTKRDLLEVIFDLSETVSAAYQEPIEAHSEGAISPYCDYKSLRSCVITAIQSGEGLYRSEFTAHPEKRITDREIFAAVLLSRCDVTDSGILDAYDSAIAKERSAQKQALLLNAAATIADRNGSRASYLSQYVNGTRDVRDSTVTRVLSACYLAETLSDQDLRAVFVDATARMHISLPDILAPLDAKTRFRVFKTIFLVGALSPGEPFWYALELLRSVFTHPATHDGSHGYSDKEGRHSDFLFNVAPAQLRSGLHLEACEALGVLVDCDALWEKRSNLWRHFGLPDEREDVRRLLERYAGRSKPGESFSKAHQGTISKHPPVFPCG